MTDLPTPAEQRAAGLETTISDAIVVALGGSITPPTAAARPPRRPHRALPPGVYSEAGRCLIARFSRHDGGRLRGIPVARGAPGDFSAATALRLARQCAEAAARWDAEHR